MGSDAVGGGGGPRRSRSSTYATINLRLSSGTQSSTRYRLSFCKIFSTSFRCWSDSWISFLDLFCGWTEDFSLRGCQSQHLSQAFTFTSFTKLTICYKFGLFQKRPEVSFGCDVFVSDVFFKFSLFFPVTGGELNAPRIFFNDFFYFFPCGC